MLNIARIRAKMVRVARITCLLLLGVLALVVVMGGAGNVLFWCAAVMGVISGWTWRNASVEGPKFYQGAMNRACTDAYGIAAEYLQRKKGDSEPMRIRRMALEHLGLSEDPLQR